MTDSSFTTTKLSDVDRWSEEQCWAAIDRASRMLNDTGFMQAEMKADPVYGPKFKELSVILLTKLVESFDLNESPDDEEIEEVGSLFQQIQILQARYGVDQIQPASIAMQQLDIRQMITSINENLEGMGLSEADVENIRSTTPSGNVGAVEISERLKPFLNAGIALAGGHAEFTRLQAETASTMPEQVKENISQSFAVQVSTAVMRAWVEHGAKTEMVQLQCRATIEMIIAAKMALSVSHVAAPGASMENLIDVICESAKRKIVEQLGLAKEAAEAEAPKRQVNVEATHFSEAKQSNVFQFPGNRTIN